MTKPLPLASSKHPSTPPFTPQRIAALLDQLPGLLRRSRLSTVQEHDFLIRAALTELKQALRLPILRALPSWPNGEVRTWSISQQALAACGASFDQVRAARFLRRSAEAQALSYAEVCLLPNLWRLAALRQLASGQRSSAQRGIRTLNALSGLPCGRFLEEVSALEAELRQDPAGLYAGMTANTRQQYRARVQRLARQTKHSELEVARTAHALAQEAGGAQAQRLGHVGEYLLGASRPLLLARLGRAEGRWKRWLRNSKIPLYLISIALLTLLTLGLLWLVTELSGLEPPSRWILLSLSAIPAIINASALVAWLITLLVPPRPLPELDLSLGLSPEAKTAVVMPVLVGSVREIRTLLARLERHYLGNADPLAHFVLLSDFPDALAAVMPQDAALAQELHAGIAALNERYGPHFSVFQRPRQWNAAEGCWMAYERKRGKLEQFNDLLLHQQMRPGEVAPFSSPDTFPEALRDTRFVLTLDADTEMLPGTLRRLAGMLAHPLNRPELDQAGELRSGFTLLQPRLETQPRAARQSLFTRLSGGESSPDLYSPLVSEAYHDLFGEAIFTGKGLYDVAAFTRTLQGRVPRNALLSHDLFEGLHGRVGWAGGSVLLEDVPSHPAAYLKRLERWVRGDWQLLPWLGSGVPLQEGRGQSAFDALGRWKIVHNLLRSLFAPALLALLLYVWLVLPGPLWPWTLLAALALGLPFLTGLLRGSVQWKADLVRWGLALALLPQEALTVLGAVRRAVVRLWTGRRRLQWLTAAQAQVGRRNALPLTSLGAVILAGWLAMQRPQDWGSALPLLALWTAFPLLANFLSREETTLDTPELSPAEEGQLRLLARRTWLFFEHFVGPEDHWLPPDNYQEEPGPMLAHRTSPTNIGLMLLSSVSAHDFGYLGFEELVARLERTFDTLERLERHQGHWLNWYDTQSLTPLLPRFISSVDSGNLLGALIGLRQALLDGLKQPLWRAADWLGYLDTLQALESTFAAAGQGVPPVWSDWLRQTETRLRAALDAPETWSALLDEVTYAPLPTAEELPPALAQELAVWTERVQHHLAALRARRATYLPWLVDQRWPQDLKPLGTPPPNLEQLPELIARAQRTPQNRAALDQAQQAAQRLIAAAQALVERAEGFIREMQWDFLYDPDRQLLSVGWHLDARRRSGSDYDLLASEARLSSYLAVACGGLDLRCWTGLGRPMTLLDGERTLLSWTGTMFEYLMPALLLRSPKKTLLDDACRRAIAVQRQYAQQHDLPWGISESGYSRQDEARHYQYRAFGVPQLALHHPARPRLVISPYASLLALPWAPQAVLENLARLERLGMRGRYGCYEALDYGSGQRPSQKPRQIKSFMAHHQGMILVSLGNTLTPRSLVQRFHRDPRVQTAEALLFERTPRRGPLLPAWTPPTAAVPEHGHELQPWEVPASERDCAAQLLHGGERRVLLDSAGGGASAWRNIQLSRWRRASGGYGHWLYLSEEGGQYDPAETEFFSISRLLDSSPHHPPEVSFSAHQAEFRRSTDHLEATLTVTVSPEGVEIRCLRLLNHGPTPRQLRAVWATEVALNVQRADVQSPAFSSLAVESELDAASDTLLLWRRNGGGGAAEGMTWAQRLLSASPGVRLGGFETRREAWIGRGRTAADPAVLNGAALENFTGTPLDPAVVQEAFLTLQPEEPLELFALSAAGHSRAAALASLLELPDAEAVQRAIQRAAREAETELRELDFSPGDLSHSLKLTGALLRPRPPLADTAIWQGQPGLWKYGLSGDHPLLLLEVHSAQPGELLPQVLRYWRFWKARQWPTDLVLLNLGDDGYAQDTQLLLQQSVSEEDTESGPGRIYLVRGNTLPPEELKLLRAAAELTLSTNQGSLEEQLPVSPSGDSRRIALTTPAPARDRREAAKPPQADPPASALPFSEFSANGREYLIHLRPGQSTPLPWVNVLANPLAGSLVSEAGSSSSWVGNASEFRLTPWSGDALLDPSGEALHLHDPATGQRWSLPRPQTPYLVRHGTGYTRFEAQWQGLELEATHFVPLDAPLKIVRVRLHNTGPARQLELSYALRWCLGNTLEDNRQLLHVEHRPEWSALLARQPWNPEFVDQVAFLGATHPAAAQQDRLQLPLTLAAGERGEWSFLLGAGQRLAGAVELLQQFRSPQRIETAWQQLQAGWTQRLGQLQVKTPDPLLDTFLNHWLLYQTLSARIWGRCGFSQPGGAFGFRDQLQDVLALLHSDPALVRAHLLEVAQQQFTQGDVLHWWHPPGGRGVRTHINDDLLWLPYVLDEYLRHTGDEALLDEAVPFLVAEELHPGEHERYASFPRSPERYSLLEHALRAIERADRRGEHGLPLIGSGDWNDGLNRVGAQGRGESVWLGFFIFDILKRYAQRLERRGDLAKAQAYRQRAEQLREAVEAHGWDDQWYRRAFHDDGEWLGRQGNPEAELDLLPQAWAVLSGLASPERAGQAMEAVRERLWRTEPAPGQCLLLTPPFDRLQDVGYIQSYPPGIRENGGQYTHAAVWAALAFARLGQGDLAHRLLHTLLPPAHSQTPEQTARYRGEPYAVAGDVYSHPQHQGRVGWTWYTGAAGWLYSAALGGLLGVQRRGQRLQIKPCLPPEWSGYELWYRWAERTLHIEVVQRAGQIEVRVDGELAEDGVWELDEGLT